MIYCRKFFVRYYAKGHSLWDLSREHWYYWKYRYCNVDTLEAFVTALPVPNMKWLALEMSRRCKLPGGHASWWWRHQMETFSALLALCVVTDEFPSQRPVMRSFAIFFHLPLNKRLRKQSWGWWFETPCCSLWRHCNVVRKFSNFDRIRLEVSKNLKTEAHFTTSQRRHNERDGISNHRRFECILNCLVRHRRKYESSASLAFVRGIHRSPMNFPHKCFHLMTSSWTEKMLKTGAHITNENLLNMWHGEVITSVIPCGM